MNTEDTCPRRENSFKTHTQIQPILAVTENVCAHTKSDRKENTKAAAKEWRQFSVYIIRRIVSESRSQSECWRVPLYSGHCTTGDSVWLPPRRHYRLIIIWKQGPSFTWNDHFHSLICYCNHLFKLPRYPFSGRSSRHEWKKELLQNDSVVHKVSRL